MTSLSDVLGKVLVVIPTYNELQSLPVTIEGLLTQFPDASVLVVDDNSPDGTGVLADEIAGLDSRVSVLHRTAKNGLGAAYLAGFQWGIDHSFDVICEMDADGSHRPEDFPKLMQALADSPEVDMVLGSRWVPGGSVVNWPKHRELLSRGGNTYVRVMLDLGLKDATGGFRAYRAHALKAMDFDAVSSHGYCFQVDMSRFIVGSGGAVREVPIVFVERRAGESKMSGNIVREALWNVTKWGVQKRAAQLRSIVQR